MANSYVGFKVEVTSSHMGKIVGIVSSVTEKQIELTDATIDNCSTSVPTLPIESCFIKSIRFLSTLTSDSSDTTTPQKDETARTSTRARRREMLRNIPNTYTAYVCPDSPPLIHKTLEPSPNRNPAHGASGLQQLDAALARVSVRQSTDNRPPKNRHFGMGTKRRSFSLSETAYNSSDVSGTESDAFHRHNNYPHHHYHNNSHHPTSSGRHVPNRPNYHNNSSNGSGGISSINNHNNSGGGFNSRAATSNRSGGGGGGGGSKHQQTADWDHIRVEEFIDEDFDFEGNLALFDKNAFYEMVNLREGNPINDCNNRGLDSTSKTPFHLIEGPDGVGVPLLENFQQKQQCSQVLNPHSTGKSTHPASNSTPITKSKPNKMSDSVQSNQSTNLLSTLMSGHSDQAHGAKQSTPSIINNTSSLNVSGRLNTTGSLTPTQTSQQQQSWYTQVGQRVPIYTSDTRNRLLHYLANGVDCSEDPRKSSTDAQTLAFSWGRILEAAGRSIVDHYTNYHRQSYRTPQHIVHRPPPRILILPNGTNLSGSLALTIARNLAIRGACVLISDPITNQAWSAPATFPSSVYESELELLGHLAPKPNRYGLDSDEDHVMNPRFPRSQNAEQLDEDEEVENLLSIVPNQSGLGGPVDLSQSDQIIDYGPVSQIWMSRMPGFKLLRRPTSIFKLPNNIQIDLVIMGYPDASSNSTIPYPTSLPCDPIIAQWLSSHSALGLMIHLLPDWATFYQSKCCLLPNARYNWIMELGIPVIQPNSTESQSNAAQSRQSHILVDIGLGRNLVRRIIGDLKSLPPYGLFDMGSIAELHTLAKVD